MSLNGKASDSLREESPAAFRPAGSRMRLCALEVLIVLLMFAFGAVTAFVYLGKARAEQAGVAGIELLYGPAVMMAYGYGYISPDLQKYPELRAFLRNQRQDLPRDLLPDIIEEADSEVAEYHRYLLYAVAASWKIFGVSWKSLEPLLALMAGWCAVAVYGLMRLGMNRILSVVLTFLVAASPGMLCVITDPRDFSKAPFLLSILMGIGWILRAGMTPGTLALAACLSGLLTGAGMGFRQDVAVFAPLVLAALCVAPCRKKGTFFFARVFSLLVFIVCFLASGWPMLTRMEGGAGPDHHIIQGFSRKHSGNLGVESPVYETLASSMDNYVFASVYSHQQRTSPETFQRFTYNSPAHEVASRHWLLEVIRMFPGDLLARGYGAALHMVEYGNAYPPLTLAGHSWMPYLLPVHQAFADHMRRFGLVYAAALLLLVGGRSVLVALVMLAVALYACGYVAMQCEYRHTFHLTFVPFWIVGCLLYTLGKAVLARLRHGPGITAWKPILLRVVLVAGLVPLLLVTPLVVLRAYQSETLQPVKEAYASPKLVPVPVTREERPGWTVFAVRPQPGEEAVVSGGVYGSDLNALYDCVSLLWDEDRRSGNTRTRYLALAFEEIPAGTPLLVLYDTPIPWNDFTQMLAVGGAPGDYGAKTYFFPVYELFMHGEGVHARNRFTGVALPASVAEHVLGLYEVDDIRDFRLLLHVTKTAAFETTPWYQSINLAPGVLSFYRPEVGSGMLLQYAEAVRTFGSAEDARQVLLGLLLTLKDPEQCLRTVRKLLDMGFHKDALLAISEGPGMSGDLREDQGRLLIEIGEACYAQGDQGGARRAYNEADACIPGEDFSKLLISDYYMRVGAPNTAAACSLEFAKYHPGSAEADSRVQSALNLLGQNEEGLASLRELYVRYPESGRVQLALAGALEHSGEYKKALELALRVFENEPGSLEARIRVMSLYSLAGHGEQGTTLLHDTIQEYPDKVEQVAETIIATAHLLVTGGARELAAELCRIMIAGNIPGGGTRLELARILKDAGDSASACTQFRLLATDAAAGTEAARLLESCFYGEASDEERVSVWRELVAANPGQTHLRERLALALYDSGSFSESATLLENSGPGLVYEEETIPRIAVLKMTAGKMDEGVEILEGLLASRPDMAEDVARILSRTAEILRVNDQASTAALLLEQAVCLVPSGEDVWMSRMPRPGESQGIDAAMSIGREAFQRIAEPWQVARRLDDLLVASQNQEQRRRVWLDLAEEFPDNTVINVYLAKDLLDAGQCLEAVGIYKEFEDRFSGRPEIMACFGVALACSGQANEGRKRIEEAIGQEPQMTSFAAASCLRTGDARAALGDGGSAIQLYETALRMDPSDRTARVRLGEMYGDAGRMEDASKLYQDIIRGDPGSPQACQSAGRWDLLLQRSGDPLARAEAWRGTLRDVPDTACLLQCFLVALMDAGAYPEAMEVCKRALDHWPETATFRLVRAVLLCHLGNTTEGIAALDAVSLDPADVPGALVENMATLALSLACRQKFPEAERLALAAVRLEPANLWWIVRLGEIFAIQGKNGEALEKFREVLIRAPESPRSAAWLNAVSVALGGGERRVREWESLAAVHPDSAVVRKGLEDARAGKVFLAPQVCK